VNTIGAGSYRCSHYDPNMAQIPTRNPEYGHACRELYIARPGFTLMGFDGSAMQLRLLAHYLAQYDGGAYAEVFEKGLNPHEYMRDIIGVDLMGEGEEGKGKGKTLNYALLFGGGLPKLGSIVKKSASKQEHTKLGELVMERMGNAWGTAYPDLKEDLKKQVEKFGYVTGLDGRKIAIAKPHTTLAFLLQAAEAVVMRRALVRLDRKLQAEGLRCGVLPSGVIRPLSQVDYEFCANVHDEAQADVRPAVADIYEKHALRCVRDAGRDLKVRCVLKSDVKRGPDWTFTH